jgi:hypothetical protein
MERLGFLIDDYKQLREESLQSMRNRSSILTFGLGVIGVIFHAATSAFSIKTFEGYLLCLFIFNIALPVLSLLILALWMGEAARMSRIGIYLKERELLINLIAERVFPDNCYKLTRYSHFNKLIYWENYLREDFDKKKTRQLIYPYYAVIMIFVGISITSIILAYLFPMVLLKYSIKKRLTFLILSFILEAAIVFYLWKKGSDLK